MRLATTLAATVAAAVLATSPARSADPTAADFAGNWAIGSPPETVDYYFSLLPTFEAVRADAPAVRGRWELVGREARVTWPDGARDVIRPHAGGYVKVFYATGFAFGDPAVTNSQKAVKDLTGVMRPRLPDEGKPAAVERQKNPGGTDSFRRGEQAYLDANEPQVWVTIDEKSQGELTGYSREKNVQAIQQMMREGRVLVCARRTKVTVVDPGLLTTTVRIMDGKHAGRNGIVPSEWVRR